MTFGGTRPVASGKFFGYFQRHWNYCPQREVHYNSLEVFCLTSVVFIKLEEEWKKNKWDIEELKWICSALDNNYSMLDLSHFLNDEFAYLDHAKKLSLLKIKMSLAVYESFENGNYILEENIKLVTNFICGNLISWSPNRSYYQAQYNYATKLYHVFRWRKKCGFRPIAKKEEAICNDELVDFFADEKHKNCIWSTV